MSITLSHWGKHTSHINQSDIKETRNILTKGSIDHNFLAEEKTFLVVLPKEGNWSQIENMWLITYSLDLKIELQKKYKRRKTPTVIPS